MMNENMKKNNQSKAIRCIHSALLVICVLFFPLQVDAQNLLGSWNGKLNVGAQSLTVAFNLTKDASGTDVCTMDSPDQGVGGIPTTIDFISEDSVCLKVKQLGVTYTAKLQGDELKGTFAQNGMSFELNLKKEVQALNRPQNPVQPYPYQTEEVSFSNDKANAVFSGTLTYPVGYEAGQKVPVVLLVSGSGLQNRDEEIFEHRPFLVIADFFARNGIATLRYDDRGFGKSTGNGKNATTADFAEDAQAGIDFLKQTGKFGKVGVAGHSEGASIAFILGAKQTIDFVISMGGIGVKVDSALTAQTNRILKLTGVPSSITVQQFRQQALAQNQPWMSYFVDYDPTADIRGTKCPILAINGSKDVQVVSDLNLPAIKSLMNNDSRSKAIEYPDLNHLFQSCKTGLTTEYRGIETTIEPIVLEDMVQWLKAL